MGLTVSSPHAYTYRWYINKPVRRDASQPCVLSRRARSLRITSARLGSDMFETKLKKDGQGGDDDDVKGLPQDPPEASREDGDNNMDDVAAVLEDPDDDRGAISKYSCDDLIFGQRGVQVLAIRANFPISTINGYTFFVLGRYKRYIPSTLLVILRVYFYVQVYEMFRKHRHTCYPGSKNVQ